MKRLVAKKIDVSIEAGAGERARFSDDEYKAAGATVEPTRAALFASADAIIRVRIPTIEEVGAMKEGADARGAVLRPLHQQAVVKAIAAWKMMTSSRSTSSRARPWRR